MAFNRKDSLNLALGLASIGVTLAGIVFKTLGLLLIGIAALIAFGFVMTRERGRLTSLTDQYSDAAQLAAKRERALQALQQAHGAINPVYLAFITASNDDEIAAA